MEKYKRNQNIIDGSLDDNLIMMHLEKGKYFGLNQVGKRIWELIEQPKSLDELSFDLTTEFNVSPELCKKEVLVFLQKSIDFNIIVKE